MPGRLKPLANNIFNVIFITSPVSSEGLKAAQVGGRPPKARRLRRAPPMPPPPTPHPPTQ
jgi:hypothetical protein